jgi:hypothetical protein
MKRILDELKPEAAYFTELGGRRTGLLIIHMEATSQIPSCCPAEIPSPRQLPETMLL